MKRLFKKTKNALRAVRHRRVRSHLSGTAECPRLSVFRSLRVVSAQLVDDTVGKTLAAVSAREIKPKGSSATKQKVENKNAKVADAYLTGKLLAEKALAKGVKRAVFDRGGYSYHGRVKALAEGARDGGLNF